MCAGNYLRARGEYLLIVAVVLTAVELPPRTRRIPMQKTEQAQAKGTTSAHAENTEIDACGFLGSMNYLRARGEYCY